jgi:hypothetical protein
MDIFTPNKRIWIPDNTIADSLASPPAISRMIAYNTSKRICSLTPHRVMMGAAGGGVPGDVTSYDFDGTGDYLSIPDHADWDVAGSNSDNWTIDFWVKHRSTPTTTEEHYIVQSEGNSNNAWYLKMNTTHGLVFGVSSGGDVGFIRTTQSGGAIITDTNWHHIAMIKKAAEYGVYVDGSQYGYVNDSSIDTFAGALWIARFNDGSWPLPFDGNIDDIRIIQSDPFGGAPNSGKTDTIIIPTSQHTSDANTKLLINGGETKTGTSGSGATFTDSGNTGHTVTENGNAIEDTVVYKW